MRSDYRLRILVRESLEVDGPALTFDEELYELEHTARSAHEYNARLIELRDKHGRSEP